MVETIGKDLADGICKVKRRRQGVSLRPGKKTRQSLGKLATASLWRNNRRTLQNLTIKTFSYDYKKDTQKGHKILAFFCLIAVVSNRDGTGRKVENI